MRHSKFDLAAGRNSYTIFRSCFENKGESLEEYLLTFVSTWDESSKKAEEIVDVRFIYYHDDKLRNDQTYKKTLTAECSADPWLNKIGCKNDTISPPTPTFWVLERDGYPISATTLTDTWRRVLRSQYAAVQRKIAPAILLPKPNAKFSNGQLVFEGRVTVPDDDDHGKWKVEIELNMDQSQPGAHAVPLKASNVVTGVGTAWIYKDLPYNGFWLVRARSTSPVHKSEWSDYVRFEIAGSKGLKLDIQKRVDRNVTLPWAGTKGMTVNIESPAPGQVIIGNEMTVRVTLPQGAKSTKVNLEFTHNTKPIQVAPLWQKFPVLSGYDTAANPAGIKVSASNFPFKGKWRVSAQVATPGAPWSNPVEFELKPLHITPDLLENRFRQ